MGTFSIWHWVVVGCVVLLGTALCRFVVIGKHSNVGQRAMLFPGLRAILFILEAVFLLLTAGGVLAFIAGWSEIDQVQLDPRPAIALGSGIFAVLFGLIGLLIAGAVHVLIAIEANTRRALTVRESTPEEEAALNPF